MEYTCDIQKNVLKYIVDYFFGVRQMYIHDSHVHTKYSFDGDKGHHGEIGAVIEAAISRGVSEISITDHLDIDGILDGIYPPYEADAVKNDVFAAKEKYKGKIRVNYGVELGQPHARKAEAEALLEKQGFDFVIGSLHNLRGCPDFYFLKMDLMCDEQIDYLIKQNISELLEIADFPGITTVAHITYIERYLTACKKPFSYERYADGFEKLFRKLIDNGISMEINTSGLRKGGITMPGCELCALYRDCGGKLITIGSDAHRIEDIGAGIEETAAMLRKLGFKSQTVVRDGKLTEIEL